MSLMTKAESECIAKYVTGATRYLEWGAGESTRLACSNTVLEKIFVVESSLEFFISQVLTDPKVREAHAEGKLNYKIVNLGPVGMWGVPSTADLEHLWPNYVLSPFLDHESKYDVALIDGRFRVACALACMLASPAIPNILIHDYAPRSYYHILERFAEVVHRVDTLVVLRKKNRASISGMRRLLRSYMYRPEDTVFHDGTTLLKKIQYRLERFF
jgi:hypothetical protein